MNRDELVKQIGEHVLSCFETYTEKSVGKKVVVPNLIPKSRSAKEFKIIYPRFEDWIITVDVSAPTICMITGPNYKDRKWLSAKEYYKYAEKLGIE